jgi:hypothetical protein
MHPHLKETPLKKKLLTATVAATILVAAGVATAAITSPGVASAQEDSEEPTEETNVRPFKDHSSILEDVLSDLVADGVIDQSQADAILEALESKAAEFKSEAENLRGLISGFLEDGVITAEELDQLPDVFPFNNLERFFGDALDDGELTQDEFSEAFSETFPHPKRGQFWFGARLGALLDDGGIDQEEFDALPDDHPLKQVDVSEYLDDGIISIDEFRELKQSQSDSGDGA